MSERMYLIVPLGYPLKEVEGAITESELRNRWGAILEWLNDHQELAMGNIAFATFLNILLHGEGKEEPLPGAIKWVGNDAYSASTGEYLYTKKEPDPWEAWVEEMPHLMVDDVWSRDNWKNWFRKMPRGK